MSTVRELQPSNLSIALEYAARGWHVLPLYIPDTEQPGGCSCGAADCGQAGKHPTPQHGLNSSSKQERQIRLWWARRPHANIGIRTGSISGFLAFDIDPRHGGDTNLLQLVDELGLLPETLTTLTGGGGMHLLFQHPGFHVGNDAEGKLGAGIDIRGDGGYIVAPPSLHSSGSHYAWHNDVPIAALPEIWLARLPRPKERTLALVPTPGDEGDGEYWLDQALLRARNGERNKTAFWLACQLRDTGLDEAAAAGYVQRFSSHQSNDFTEREAIHALESAFSQSAREPAKSQTPPARIISHGRMVNVETGQIDDDAEVAEDGEFDDDDDVEPDTPPLLADGPVPRIKLEHLKDAVYQEEYGDARLLARLFKNRLIFDHGADNYFFWSGHSWKRDGTKQVYHLVGGTLAAVYLRGAAECRKKIGLLEAEAGALEGEEAEAKSKETAEYKKLVGKLYERANGLRTRKRMNNVLAEAEAFLPVSGDEWDRQPLLLAVANGVVNLSTGQLHHGKPGDYLRAVAPTAWTGIDTPAPGWDTFLSEMFAGRPEMPAFIQRLCGVGIRGDTSEHRLPILYGARGRNGKDVFLGTLQYVLGEDLASAVNKDVLVGSTARNGAAEPYLMKLQGRRLAWVSETSDRAQLNAGQVKLITGGGHITARPLYGNTVTFAPTHLLWLITNYLPQGASDDDALWDRLFCIECKERFIDTPDPKDPHEHKKDGTLGIKLHAEASGILAWLVRGHLAWQEQGLNPPAEVFKATTAYKDSQDVVAQFIEDVCVVEPEATVRASELYAAYKAWAGTRNILAGNIFGVHMRKRYERKDTKRGRVYEGLRIVSEEPARPVFGEPPEF